MPVWITAQLSHSPVEISVVFPAGLLGMGESPWPALSLILILDPFNACSHQDRIPSLPCPRVAGPCPWFLPVGQGDFCRGASTEVLPCSQPASGEFCQAGSRCPRNRINPAYLFLFILLKHEMFALYNHPPPGAAQRSSPSTIPSADPKRRCLCHPQNQPLSGRGGGLGWLL